MDINDYRVRLAQDDSGKVALRRIGLSNLNCLVEFHIFAIDSDFDGPNVAGKALSGLGIAAVKATLAPAQLRCTTSHEMAHAAGLIPPNATTDGVHCKDNSCLMAPSNKVYRRESLDFLTDIRGLAADVLFDKKTSHKVRIVLQSRQFDFCGDCKTTLHNDVPSELNTMRMSRLTDGLPRSVYAW